MNNELTREHQLAKELTLRQLVQFIYDVSYAGQAMADVGGNGMQERLALFDLHPDVYDYGIDKFDICKTSLPKQYPVIICMNTFEHILDPVRAAENIVKSLAPGGHLFVTTLFVYPKHNYDEVVDTYRYTDTALSWLFRDLEEKRCWFENENHPPQAVRVSYIGVKRV